MDAFERLVETARKYDLADNDTLAYFVRYVANVPYEHRDTLINDPVWVVGFVSGLVYARYRRSSQPATKADVSALRSILENTLKNLSGVPYTGAVN